jgi:CheY-like chemotaxis protein
MVQMSNALRVTTRLHGLTAIKFDISPLQAHARPRKGGAAMHIQIAEGIGSVLIVEDEMIVAMLIEDLMRELGVTEVHICPDTVSAVEAVATKSIDCAILDLRLRDGSSTPVADALAEKNIPFVFSSGSDAGALQDRHADRPLIGKPFLDDDLKLIVLDTWTLFRAGRASGRAVGGIDGQGIWMSGGK